MKITIVSNFLNAHTAPLCRALHVQLGDDFAFVETKPRDEVGDAAAYRMGYAYFQTSGEEQPEWVIRGWEDREKAQRVIFDCDAVLIANASDNWILPRLKAGKLTFRTHERWYRNGLNWYALPRAVMGGWLHHGRFPSLYLLCASAYTAADAARVGCFRGKAFRWGYFPEFREYSRERLTASKAGAVPTVLWAGRMIGLKQPEDAVTACLRLKKAGYCFRLILAGSGPEEEKLQKLSVEMGGSVLFPGDLTPGQLRTEMEKADIFLFTSHRQEGWGAVLNEAMNSGCAVVASHAAGATPYLVRDGENGLVYPSGDIDGLTQCIRRLLENAPLRCELGWQAYETIRDPWCPEVAAGRLITLCEGLLDGRKPDWEDGPGSAAPVLDDEWYSGDLEKRK